MKTAIFFSRFALSIVILAGSSMLVAGQDAATPAPHGKDSHATQSSDDSERAEGQKRFQQNCGRCHRAPEVLSPRVTPAVLMHMRIRANLTAEDQRLILKFMAQ